VMAHDQALQQTASESPASLSEEIIDHNKTGIHYFYFSATRS